MLPNCQLASLSNKENVVSAEKDEQNNLSRQIVELPSNLYLFTFHAHMSNRQIFSSFLIDGWSSTR